MTRKNTAAPQPGHCIALADEYAAIGKLTGGTERQNARNGNRQYAIERELTRTPALSMGDIIAKARVLAECERQGISPEAKLAASIKSDLERFARPAGDDAAILALAEEYRSIPTTFPDDVTDEELTAHGSRQMEIIEALPAMPAATPEAIKFKLVAFDYVSQTFSAPELISRFVASIADDLDRMAGAS